MIIMPTVVSEAPANPLSSLTLVRPELELVEERLRDVVKMPYSFLADVLEAIIAAGGKRLRPVLVLLSARAYDYDVDHLTAAAAAIELLHTATLVHDDTIDHSLVRRGKPTLNSILSNGATVLTGDYLFATAASLCTQSGSLRAVRIFADVLVTIMHGELAQVAAGRSVEKARANYFSRIYAKTASLFEASCQIGAIVGHAPESAVDRLGQFGRQVGMAFQIVDDILDFESTTADLGKPVGNDLRQGTVTLPAMLFIDEARSETERQLVAEVITGQVEDEAQVNEAIRLIKQSNALERAYAEAQRFSREAKEALRGVADNDVRAALEQIADFSISRKS